MSYNPEFAVLLLSPFKKRPTFNFININGCPYEAVTISQVFYYFEGFAVLAKITQQTANFCSAFYKKY